MRRFGWLLLVAVLFLSGGIGYQYWKQKQAQAANAPARPDKLAFNTTGQNKDWCWSQNDGMRTITEICAQDMRQVENPPRIELEHVVLKIFHKGGTTFDLVKCDHAELRMQESTLFSEGAVDMTLGLKVTPGKPDEIVPSGRMLKIKSSGVRFDTQAQTATTDRLTQFDFDRGYGHAMGAVYDPGAHQISLKSQVLIHWKASTPKGKDMEVEAGEAVYLEAESKVLLKPWARLKRDTLTMNAGPSVVTLEKGNIQLVDAEKASGSDKMPNRQLDYAADKLQMIFGEKNLIERITGETNATLAAHSVTGDTNVTTNRIDLTFTVPEKENQSQLTKALANGNTVVFSKPVANGTNHPPNRILKSEVVELNMRPGGEEIEKVLTHTPGEIEFIPNKPTDRYRRMNGDRIYLDYAVKNQLETFRSSKVTTFTKGEPKTAKKEATPDVTTASGELMAKFDPNTGQMQTLEQWTDFRYKEGTREARATKARMEQAQSMVFLDGKASMWDPTGATTADKIAMDQKSGDMLAEGNVTSTRQPEAKPKPGSMLEPSEPTQATADKMTTRDKREKVLYEGKAVMWQSSNRIEADRIDIDRKKQQLEAKGSVFSQFLDKPKEGKKTKATAPVYTVIRSDELYYSDVDKLAHYKQSVVLDRPDMNVKSSELRAWFKKTEKETQLDHALAEGAVRILQATAATSTAVARTRTSTGNTALYEVAEEKVTMEGGEPMLVDSLRGTTKGQKLTWFSNDDRLLVDGVVTDRAVSTIKRQPKKKK